MRSVLERLQSENAQIYAAYGYDSFNNWIAPLVLLASSEDDAMTAARIAKALRVSAPTMSQTLRDMTTAGLVAATDDPDDKRRKRLRLTVRGRTALKELEPLLDAYLGVSEDLDREAGGLLRAIDALADALDRKSLTDRVADRLAKQNGTA
jgi:DNA-binding MarR family transcriptional regulator